MSVHATWREFKVQTNIVREKSIYLTILLVVALILGVSALMPAAKVFAASEIDVSGGSSLSGYTDVFTDLSHIAITGAGNDPVPVTLYVPYGTLYMPVRDNLTFTSNTNNVLSFSGSRADVNAALGSLSFFTNRVGTVQLSVSLTAAGEVYYPGNGHLYEIVEADTAVNYMDAKSEAEEMEKYGSQGYLLTVTNQQENDFISDQLSGSGWMGASDRADEGDWIWDGGPEQGLSFWSGLADGSPVGGLYSNWADGEPNQSGEEDCSQFYADGSGWNDLPCEGSTLDYYVVEYGATGDLPAVESETIDITTAFPAHDIVTVDSCSDLQEIDDNSADHRYDTISLTTDINCTGEDSIGPMFTDVDPDFGTLTYRGTFDGNGHTITLDIGANNPSSGLFHETNTATFTDLNIAGSVMSSNYCVGAIVGTATDTNLVNIQSTVAVEGPDRTGGLIGCYNAFYYDSAISGSAILGDTVSNNAGQATGGILGLFHAMYGSSLHISDADVSGEVRGATFVGGLVGDADIKEGATVDLDGNAVTGLVQGTYGVGGYIGEARVYEASTLIARDATTAPEIEIANGSSGGLLGNARIASGSTFTLSDVTVEGSILADNSNDNYIGGLVGEATIDDDGTVANIENAHADIAIQNTASNIGGLFGGLDVRYGAELEMSEVSSAGDIIANGQVIGGVVGRMVVYGGSQVAITSATASGAVLGNEQVGGLFGYIEVDPDGDEQETSFTLQSSTASGDVMSEDGIVGGAIGYLQSFAPANVQLSNVAASGDVVGFMNVGGLVGQLWNSVDGVAASAMLQNATASGDVTGTYELGGLVGEVYGFTIDQSSATGAVQGDVPTGEGGEASSAVGGLVGYMSGASVMQSYASGAVSGVYEVGGLVGYTTLETYEGCMYDAEEDEEICFDNPSLPVIESSYATGAVTGTNEVGGLIGDGNAVQVSKSYATGAVVGAEQEYEDEWTAVADSIGGFAGEIDSADYEAYNPETGDYEDTDVGAYITESYATGAVTGTTRVGGFIGENENEGNAISNSYARGAVTATGEAMRVGGFVGLNDNESTLENVYATGAVAGVGESIGGLIGENDEGTYVESFWDQQSSGMTVSAGGTGKTTAYMKQRNTFMTAGWDYSTIWGQTATVNNGYPCLRWSNDSCAGVEDADLDGIPNDMEAAGPNGGDANDDGIPDGEQSHVASYRNLLTGHYSVLVLDEVCAISVVASSAEHAQITQDAGFNYPAGLMNFTADCGIAGYTTGVKVIQYGDVSENFVLRKFNTNNHSYAAIAAGSVSHVMIGGQQALIGQYSITDGGILDMDGQANGVIVDPVGLAQSAVGTPNTGFGGSL